MNPHSGYRNSAEEQYEEDDQNYDDTNQYDEGEDYPRGTPNQRRPDNNNYRQQQYAQDEDYEDYQRQQTQDLSGRGNQSFQKSNRNIEQAPYQGESGNRSFHKSKSQKQIYEEEDVEQDNRDRKRSDDVKETGNITEAIDTNKVKNSKLFQKFLQTENKENPGKPQQKDGKPPSKNNSFFTNKEPPKAKYGAQQGIRPNEEIYLRQDQDYTNQDFQSDDRMIMYNASGSYGPPSKDNLSPGRHKNSLQTREEEEYYQGQGYDLRGAEVDLNHKSSSKLVSLPNPEEFPQNFQGFPPQNMPYMYPPHANMYQYPGYEINHPEIMNHPEMLKQQQQMQMQMNPFDEVLVLRAQIMELNQVIAREVEANKALDSKCTEYRTQLEKSAHNFEEFKHKILDQGSDHQQEIGRMEDKIRNLTERLHEKQSIEEQQNTELNKLRRKIDAELESRGQLLEEHEELEKRRLDDLERLRQELEKRDEEIQKLKRDADNSRHDKDSSRVSEERYLKDIKNLKSDVMELNRVNEDLRKTCDDKHQQINLGKMEISSLRDQLEAMDGQYRDLLGENDKLKRDNFTQKERLLAADSEIKSLRMTLDKMHIDITQVGEALSRAERALERERQVNADLRLQVSSGNREWEGPSSYGSRRQGNVAREYEEPRDEGYRARESGQRENVRESVQEVNKYEMRREPPKPQLQQQSYPYRKEEEYQNQQRQQQQQQQGQGRMGQQPTYVQDNYKEQGGNKFGGREEIGSKVGMRPGNEERAGNYQSGASRENKNEDRYSKVPQQAQKNLQEITRKPTDEQYNRNVGVKEAGGRNTANSKSFIQEEPNYGVPQPKLTSQNQVYKPTHNLLAWDEPPTENKPNVNKVRDQRQNITPTRERPQTRQENRQEGNFLAWDEPVVDNKPANRPRDQRQNQSPPREKPQLRQERDDRLAGNANKKVGRPESANQPYVPQQDTAREVKTLENDLMNFQMQKDNLVSELQRLDKVKIKSGANIKRKQEIEADMSQIQSNISNVKNRLRELHALLPY